METHIILFYKFVNVEDPESFKIKHLAFCKALDIKGKVLIAKEGINGSVSGSKEQIEAYKNELRNDPRFSDVEFKEEIGLHHPFSKMIVRVRKEIIRMDKEIDLSKTGKHLSPKEFLEEFEDKNVVIIDTRNDYESKAGRFKGAIIPDISTFREWPAFVDNLDLPKDTKIITYCTGGIRCEKASAYMVEKGFTNVSQLHGGIINFCQQYPNTAWEGSCFVFDDRLVSNINQKENPINPCVHCGIKSDQYRNCKIKTCNKLIFICPSCKSDFHACCSSACMKQLLR